VRTSEDRYTATAIVLHWLIALLVIGNFAWGWWMQEIPKSPPGIRADAFNLHKSIGLTLVLLMAVRLGWRVRHPAPPLPAMPVWQARAARWTHALLYVALIAMPVTGYLGSVYSGYPVKFFGMALPAWGSKQAALKDFFAAVHLYASWLLAGLVALHVAAAVKHALADRDGILGRMGIGALRRDARSQMTNGLPGSSPWR
jgi:cytochrome b561